MSESEFEAKWVKYDLCLATFLCENFGIYNLVVGNTDIYMYAVSND